MAGNDMPELTLALQQQLSALLRSNPDLIRSLAAQASVGPSNTHDPPSMVQPTRGQERRDHPPSIPPRPTVERPAPIYCRATTLDLEPPEDYELDQEYQLEPQYEQDQEYEEDQEDEQDQGVERYQGNQDLARGGQYRRSFAVSKNPRKPSGSAPPPPELPRLGDPFNNRDRAGYFPVTSAASRSAASQQRASSSTSQKKPTKPNHHQSSSPGSGSRGGRGGRGSRGVSRARGGSHGAAVRPVDTQEPDVAPAQTGSDLAPKRFSKSDSNELIHLPSSDPIFLGAVIFSQNAWIFKKQMQFLRDEGLVRAPYVHAGLKGQKLADALIEPFDEENRPIGSFDLVKHISGGRRLNNQDVKSIKQCPTLNSVKAFWVNSTFPYIVPGGWKDMSSHSPERRAREGGWWDNYCRLTEGLKLKRKELDEEAAANGQIVPNAKGKGKGKGKAGRNDEGDSDEEDERDPSTVLVKCYDCGRVYRLLARDSHLRRCEGAPQLEYEEDVDSDDDLDPDLEEEQEIQRVLGARPINNKRKASEPPMKAQEPRLKAPRSQGGYQIKKTNRESTSQSDEEGSVTRESTPQPKGNAFVRPTAYARRGGGHSSSSGRNITTPIVVSPGLSTPQDARASSPEARTRELILPRGIARGTGLGDDMEVDEQSQEEEEGPGSEQIRDSRQALESRTTATAQTRARPDSARTTGIPATTSTVQVRSLGPAELEPPSAARRPAPRNAGSSIPRPTPVVPLGMEEKSDLKIQISCLVNTMPAAGPYFRAACERFMGALDVHDRDRLPAYQEEFRLARMPQTVQPRRGGTDSLVSSDMVLTDAASMSAATTPVPPAAQVSDPSRITRPTSPVGRQGVNNINPQVSSFIARTMPDLLAEEIRSRASNDAGEDREGFDASGAGRDSAGQSAPPSLAAPSGTTSDATTAPTSAIPQALTSASSPLTDPESAPTVPVMLPPIPIRRFTRATSAMLGESNASTTVAPDNARNGDQSHQTRAGRSQQANGPRPRS